MASLLPLLQDLLPIFMPSEVQIARGGDMVANEERAERPPWYRQQAPRLATAEARAADNNGNKAAPVSEDFEPIQLLDREESRASEHDGSQGEQSPVAGQSNAGEGVSVPSHDRGGPRVFRKNAMVGFSDKMCATVLTVAPQSATTIHHHGEQEVIVYATTPGTLLTSQPQDSIEALRADIKGEEFTSAEEQPRRLELGAGDFAFIPAWTEHQVVNEAVDKEISWVVFRQGAEPIQVDLDDWDGRRLQT